MTISPSNPMFDHLLESSHRDDSNKLSNIGFGEEITVSFEDYCLHVIGTLLTNSCLAELWQSDRYIACCCLCLMPPVQYFTF